MKEGEIYYLTFYDGSFINDNGQYLFQAINSPHQAQWNHMFAVRSFTITASTSLQYGDTLVITGTNLKSIANVYAMADGLTVTYATWTTMTISFIFELQATTCTSIQKPSGTVHPLDITNSTITINNFSAKGCVDGDLYAKIEMRRGV